MHLYFKYFMTVVGDLYFSDDGSLDIDYDSGFSTWAKSHDIVGFPNAGHYGSVPSFFLRRVPERGSYMITRVLRKQGFTDDSFTSRLLACAGFSHEDMFTVSRYCDNYRDYYAALIKARHYAV